MKPFAALFNPQSVAVVGASSEPTKWGNLITRAIIAGGFPGAVYPVNRKGGAICGRPAVPSVRDIPGRVDLALVGIPAAHALDAVEECADKGAGVIVVVTAGFRETGAPGAAAEGEMVRRAAARGSRVVGPNCLGVFSAAAGLNATVLPFRGRGALGFLSQSGNVALDVVYTAQRRGLGFSKFVSYGNQCDVQAHELLEYLGDDPDTKVILAFMEGVQHGRRFVETVIEVSRRKPVAVLKAGATGSGQRAVASHTGSVAGRADIWAGALAQVGAIPVASPEDLVDLAEALLPGKLPAGNRVAVVTDGGGHGTLACDLLEARGLSVPVLSGTVQAELRGILLPQSSVRNPVDFAGAAEADLWRFARVLQSLLNCPDVDAVLVVGQFGGYRDVFQEAGEIECAVAARMVEVASAHGKPVAFHSMYAQEMPESLQILRRGSLSVSHSLRGAADVLGKLCRYSEWRQRDAPARADGIAGAPPTAAPAAGTAEFTPVSRAERLLVEARAEGRVLLTEPETRQLLDIFGLATGPWRLATTPAQAVEMAAEVGYPVVLKLVSPDVTHKARVGGVRLELRSAGDVLAAYDAIQLATREARPPARMSGVVVAPMQGRGLEAIAGVVRDPVFGPTLMLGLGGSLTELVRDVAFRVLPVSRGEILAALQELRAWEWLGARRYERGVTALCEAAGVLGAVAAALSDIEELEVNPILVRENGVALLDARAVLSRAAPEGSAAGEPG